MRSTRFRSLLLCVCALALLAGQAWAAQESYRLKDGKVYRVAAGGKKKLLEEEEPKRNATEKGLYSWILVDPELSEGMKGSKSGIYFFFGEDEKPAGFLPFEGAAYCNLAFAPNGDMFLVNFGADAVQDIILYAFDGLEKKAAFRGLGNNAWLDPVRFVFTRDDADKGSRGKGFDQQEGWLSVMVYDTVIKKLIPVREATETQDYLLTGVDHDTGKLEILERSVKDTKDWNAPDRIEEKELSIPIPAAG